MLFEGGCRHEQPHTLIARAQRFAKTIQKKAAFTGTGGARKKPHQSSAADPHAIGPCWIRQSLPCVHGDAGFARWRCRLLCHVTFDDTSRQSPEKQSCPCAHVLKICCTQTSVAFSADLVLLADNCLVFGPTPKNADHPGVSSIRKYGGSHDCTAGSGSSGVAGGRVVHENHCPFTNWKSRSSSVCRTR